MLVLDRSFKLVCRSWIIFPPKKLSFPIRKKMSKFLIRFPPNIVTHSFRPNAIPLFRSFSDKSYSASAPKHTKTMAKQPTTSSDLRHCHIDPTTTATPVTSSGAKTLLPTPHQRRSCHISSYHNVIQAPTLRSRHRDGYCALAIPRPLMMTPNVVSAPRPSILVIMWS